MFLTRAQRLGLPGTKALSPVATALSRQARGTIATAADAGVRPSSSTIGAAGASPTPNLWQQLQSSMGGDYTGSGGRNRYATYRGLQTQWNALPAQEQQRLRSEATAGAAPRGSELLPNYEDQMAAERRRWQEYQTEPPFWFL